MSTVTACAHGENSARPAHHETPELADQLSADQRAFLECVAAENARELTDAEIEVHYQWWLQQQEAERIAAELEHDRALSTSAIVAAGNVAAVDAVVALFGRRSA